MECRCAISRGLYITTEDAALTDLTLAFKLYLIDVIGGHLKVIKSTNGHSDMLWSSQKSDIEKDQLQFVWSLFEASIVTVDGYQSDVTARDCANRSAYTIYAQTYSTITFLWNVT